MEYLPYIIAIGSVATALGIGALLKMAYAARLDRKKVREALDQSNSGKMIDAAVHANDSTSKRLELIESKLDVVHLQYMEQKIENAELRGNAKHADAEIERMATEILGLRQSNHGLREELQKRDKLIADLRVTVERLDAKFRAMIGASDIAKAHADGMKEEHEANDTPIKVQMVDSPVPVVIEDYKTTK